MRPWIEAAAAMFTLGMLLAGLFSLVVVLDAARP